MSGVQRAIESGDVEGLRAALRGESANELIVWGKAGELKTHPLHYVSDCLFEQKIPVGVTVGLVEALLEAGADVNFVADNGETALIGAASMGAEDVGVMLVERGAELDRVGGLGETALHWAAFNGLEKLVGKLMEAGADRTVRDRKYGADALGWAAHKGRTAIVDMLS